jgi:hypothetical protein
MLRLKWSIGQMPSPVDIAPDITRCGVEMMIGLHSNPMATLGSIPCRCPQGCRQLDGIAHYMKNNLSADDCSGLVDRHCDVRAD